MKTNIQELPLVAPALRGIIAALGSDIIQKATGVIATFVVLSQLSTYEYGLWQLLLGVSIAFGILSASGVASMLIADVSREIGAGNKESSGAILYRASFLFVGLGIFAAVVMFFAAPFVTTMSGLQFTLFIQLLATTLVAYGFRQVYQITLQGNLLLVHAQALKALDRFSYGAAVLVFVLFFGLGITGVVYAYVFAAFVPLVLYFPFVVKLFFKTISKRGHSSTSFIEAVWHRGRWALGNDIAAGIAGSLWPWVLGYYLSIESVGLIGVAMLILGHAASLIPISYVLRSVLPRTMRSEERIHEWLVRSMKYAVWGYMIASLAMIIGLWVLVSTALPHYSQAVPLVAALLVSLPLRAMTSISGEWFFASKRQKDLFFVSSVPKLLMLLLLPFALMSGGIIGFIIWYVLNTGVIAYVRLRTLIWRTGRPINVSKMLSFDSRDSEILGRVLKLFEVKSKTLFNSGVAKKSEGR